MKRYVKSAVASKYIVTLADADLFRDRDGVIYNFGSDDLVAEVNSFEEASKVVRDYIEQNNLGMSEFSGGDVFDMSGNLVAQISYNGRIWEPGSKWFGRRNS